MTFVDCRRLVVGWLALMLAVVGCRSPQATPPSVTAGTRAESVLLTYRVEPPPTEAVAVPASHDAHQAAYHQPLAETNAPRLARTLSIRSPHPDGRAEMALVEVVTMRAEASHGASEVDPRPAWRRWMERKGEEFRSGGSVTYRWHEAWRMDVPRSDIDYLLAQLAASGYFAGGDPPSSDVAITAYVDGVFVVKSWSNIGGFEGLIAHVERHGQLVSRSPEARLAAAAHYDSPPAWQTALPAGVTSSDEAARVQPSPTARFNAQRASYQAPSYAGSTGTAGTAMALRPPAPGSYLR